MASAFHLKTIVLGCQGDQLLIDSWGQPDLEYALLLF